MSPAPGSRVPRPIQLADVTASAKAARGSSARFLKKVIATDPLVCPDCGGVMKIIAFIEEPHVIHAILVHLPLWDAPKPRLPPVSAVRPAD